MVEETGTANLYHMSNNVVDVMKELAGNKGIRALLYVDDENPLDNEHNNKIPSAKEILDAKSAKRRISPVSFEMNAYEEDRTDLRVYYNVGRPDNSGNHWDYNMHIDIICAKDLWLIRDPNGKSKIRPYEILSRVVDSIGQNNISGRKMGRIVQFQMLSVNERFDALRVYYNTNDVSKPTGGPNNFSRNPMASLWPEDN